MTASHLPAARDMDRPVLQPTGVLQKLRGILELPFLFS